jgi:hypothetical protein
METMRPSLLFLAAICLGAALPASAILIRSDRDDDEYLELATKYTSALLLTEKGGEGVLIAPRWILTSGDVALILRDAQPRSKVTIAGADYEIASIFVHPEGKAGVVNDVALILLRRPVKGVEPTLLYRLDDEQGKTVVIVGHGDVLKQGETAKPGRPADRRPRAGINTVDRVTPNTLGLEIKAPDDASDLQGAATPLDHGAPLFIETGSSVVVAGINHRVVDENHDHILGNAGDVDLYMRVSAYVPWIEAVILDVTKKELESSLDPDRR